MEIFLFVVAGADLFSCWNHQLIKSVEDKKIDHEEPTSKDIQIIHMLLEEQNGSLKNLFIKYLCMILNVYFSSEFGTVMTLNKCLKAKIVWFRKNFYPFIFSYYTYTCF